MRHNALAGVAGAQGRVDIKIATAAPGLIFALAEDSCGSRDKVALRLPTASGDFLEGAPGQARLSDCWGR
jgi:hypothetical protein